MRRRNSKGQRMEVKIEKITAEDEDKVLEFLKNTFFKVSASNVSFDMGYSIKSCPPLPRRTNP